MFRRFQKLVSCIGIKMTVALLKLVPFFSKVTVGGINFYGPANAAHEFENAIRLELPKYDNELSRLILAKQIKLDFFLYNKFNYYFPDIGLFFVPKWIFDHGTEGICQHIVFCVIGSKYTGTGLRAAMCILDRKTMHSICKEAMRQWIIDKKFPERWIPSYQVSE